MASPISKHLRHLSAKLGHYISCIHLLRTPLHGVVVVLDKGWGHVPREVCRSLDQEVTGRRRPVCTDLNIDDPNLLLFGRASSSLKQLRIGHATRREVHDGFGERFGLQSF